MNEHVFEKAQILKTLPLIMVAPNGARRTKADHPALPITISETVEAALSCYSAGAKGIHAHVRDDEGAHVLDAGLYRELISELHRSVPQMAVQITTEAVGRYTPDVQRRLVDDIGPAAVSVAMREMLPDESEAAPARDFYHRTAEAGIAVQHILYEPSEVSIFFNWVDQGVIPSGDVQLLFVLGRYTAGQQSQVSDLDPYLTAMAQRSGHDGMLDWGLCAFGSNETNCLAEAIQRGGKARIGFENSLWNQDGSIARDNAERVRELVRVTSQNSASSD